jgi:AbrB family looped-hinge helix DNA binding protein
MAMAAIAHSKLTAQGQVSVPAEVRRRLGVGPGAMLAWTERAGAIVVRRAGCFSSEDVHRALFPRRGPKRKTLRQLKEGRYRHARRRHACSSITRP